jgi:hypothetical protein
MSSKFLRHKAGDYGGIPICGCGIWVAHRLTFTLETVSTSAPFGALDDSVAESGANIAGDCDFSIEDVGGLDQPAASTAFARMKSCWRGL